MLIVLDLNYYIKKKKAFVFVIMSLLFPLACQYIRNCYLTKLLLIINSRKVDI